MHALHLSINSFTIVILEPLISLYNIVCIVCFTCFDHAVHVHCDLCEHARALTSIIMLNLEKAV